jgi:transcriptional antiterminator RfaH
VGFDVFLPKLRVRRRRRTVGSSQVEPLFPGYVFVAAALTLDVWSSVRWTRGVKAVLGCGGIPSPVPEEPIALIKQRMGPDGVIHPRAWYRPGDRVRITHGPFADLVGIMERPASRAGRVHVLLQMMGGASIELEDADLEAAS